MSKHHNSPESARKRTPRWLGVLFILAGLALNPGAVGQIVEKDRHIGEPSIRQVIWAFDAFCVLLGIWLVWRRPALPLPRFLYGVAGVGLVAAIGAGAYGTLWETRIIDPYAENRAAWRAMERSEEVIAQLGRPLTLLARDFKNLRLSQDNSVFHANITWTDLGTSPQRVEPQDRPIEWPIDTKVRTGTPGTLDVWRGFLDKVEFFKHASFKIVRGRFLDDARARFETEVAFSALAQLRSGRMASAHAQLKFRWRGHATKGWRIDDWRTLEFSTHETPQLLFREVLGETLDSAALSSARASIHERTVARFLRDPKRTMPHEHFFVTATDRHPGVSVVDLDGDGYDDIYVMARWGKNLFFHNRGDGTFEEIGARIGLDIKDHCSCAIFADLDNDGDTDVIVGRTLERTMYLVNENGKFVDRSKSLLDTPLPYLASSISVVDYDQDGLLDV